MYTLSLSADAASSFHNERKKLNVSDWTAIPPSLFEREIADTFEEQFGHSG
jgi:hypothetical protein